MILVIFFDGLPPVATAGWFGVIHGGIKALGIERQPIKPVAMKSRLLPALIHWVAAESACQPPPARGRPRPALRARAPTARAAPQAPVLRSVLFVQRRGHDDLLPPVLPTGAALLRTPAPDFGSMLSIKNQPTRKDLRHVCLDQGAHAGVGQDLVERGRRSASSGCQGHPGLGSGGWCGRWRRWPSGRRSPGQAGRIRPRSSTKTMCSTALSLLTKSGGARTAGVVTAVFHSHAANTSASALQLGRPVPRPVVVMSTLLR